jgi:hypothetical protein
MLRTRFEVVDELGFGGKLLVILVRWEWSGDTNRVFGDTIPTINGSVTIEIKSIHDF